MPFREMRLGGSPVMSSPLSRMRPEVGRSTPVRQLKKVLLPAPFGPMMARISPRRDFEIDVVERGQAAKADGQALGAQHRRPVAPPRPSRPGSARRTSESAVHLRRTCRPAGRSSCPCRPPRGCWCLPSLMSKMNSRRNAWWSSLRSILSPCGKSSPSFISRPSSASISFVGVLAAAELRLLHAELEGVHRLVVRLHVAVGQRAGGIDLLEPRHGLVEELLVRRRVERRDRAPGCSG